MDELALHLQTTPVTTLSALRRHRFSLRTVSSAAALGLLDLDVLTGRVLRIPSGPESVGPVPSSG